RVLVQRNDGGLVDDDAFAARVDQRVGRAKIDSQVAGKHAEQRTQVVKARGSVMKAVVGHGSTSFFLGVPLFYWMFRQSSCPAALGCAEHRKNLRTRAR